MAQRGKGRGSNLMGNQDFIALGPKTGSSSVSKPASSASASSSSQGGSGSMMQKAKSGNRPGAPSSSSMTSSSWESLATTSVDASDLVRVLTEEEMSGERAAAILCGAVKMLRSQRSKPDQLLYLSLLFLAKTEPHLFLMQENVIDAFCSLLKRDPKESYKSKGNVLVSVLAANVLAAAFREERNWPECFVRVYVDDAMGERLWVDHPDCKGFVDNVVTAFGTKQPSASASQGLYAKPGGESAPGRESPGPSSGSATPTRIAAEDDDSSSSGALALAAAIPSNLETDVPVQLRYQGLRNVVEHLVMEVVREQLSRRQGTDNITRNFLRFLTSACGLPEVRLTVISKIEMWVMNPKVSRVAHELLLSMSINCNTYTPMDAEVLTNFSRLRFKNKPNLNLYMQCVREIATAHPENLPAIVKQTIFNELSNARNTTNMNVLGTLFNVDGDRAAASLASVFIELLLQKDDYLRALRALLREVVRALRGDINLQVFSAQLMREKPKEQMFKDFEFKDRMFNAITDLLTLSMFLGISSPVREAINAIGRGDKGKDISPFKNYLKQVSIIQRDAVSWLLDIVPKMFSKTAGFHQLYPHCLKKVLFMVNHEDYFFADGWPAENERPFTFKAISEIPLLPETVLTLLHIGLSKSLPLNGSDIIDMVEFLSRKAALLHALAADDKDFHVLRMDKPKDFFELLFNLASYSYPETITLPADYVSPSMAVKLTYWKIFTILTLYSAHNPSVVGALAYEEFPMFRCFLEMCITNQFEFPPPSIAEPGSEIAEQLKKQDLTMVDKERKDILTLESHLAAATNNRQTITESNSLLLETLVTMDPRGPERAPPQHVLDELKKINQHCKIGHLLCRSRNPDFLINILNRQGSSNQSMPWLADLVESSEGSFGILPVECLCEFLLSSQTATHEEGEDAAVRQTKIHKRKQLLAHLQAVLRSSDSDKRSACETLDYFLRRLGSQQTRQRLLALKGLRLVLTPLKREEEEDMETDATDEDTNEAWLLTHLPKVPCFTDVYDHVSRHLRHACQVENDPATVGLYVRFLVRFAPQPLPDLADLCLDMSTIIVERSTIHPAIICHTATHRALLELFDGYVRRLIELGPASAQAFSSSEQRQEAVTVVFNSFGQPSKEATLHFFVIHAQIILLTFMPKAVSPNSEEDVRVATKLHENLLQVWFHRGEAPQAFLLSTKEEAALIPDWLKLKMIRSDSPVLVDTALRELNVQQLVLFIQSFGIPVASMSKLLGELDTVAVRDPAAVTDAVMDGTYMGQLVAVQHRRGAKNGYKFAASLGLQLDMYSKERTDEERKIENESRRVTTGVELPTIPPRSTALIPPSQVKTTLMHLFDVGSPSRMTMKEKRDTFRTLQKFLAAEMSGNSFAKPMLEATAKALDQIVRSEHKASFATAMARRPSFSCALLRLLSSAFAKHSQPLALMVKVSATLSEQLRAKDDRRSPLLALLDTFQSEGGMQPGGGGTRAPGASSPSPSKRKKADRKRKREDEETEQKHSVECNLEKDIHVKVAEALKKRSTRPLVNEMAGLLLAEEDESLKKKTFLRSTASKAGLFVDWLEMLDPEMIQLDDDAKQQLLFSRYLLRVTSGGKKRVVVPGSEKRPSRPYLLTMLTHQSGWKSLRSVVSQVLEVHNGDLDPVAVLDFLTACVYIPKLWHGVDKHRPKHVAPTDVLNLSEDQIRVFVDYHLAEAIENGTASSPEAQDVLFKGRINLLLTCLSTREKANVAVEHLFWKIVGQGEDERKRDVSRRLLLHVYMGRPSCLVQLQTGGLDSQTLLPTKIVPGMTAPTTLDVATHTILSALAATQPGRQWTSQMIDFEAAARKIAACHPLLFLRNLPLVAASLKGRTEFDFSFFRSRHHLTLYSIVMGLLDLLTPHIFRPEHREGLEETLKCYFNMINAYTKRIESMEGVINKFLTFLNDYMEADPVAGATFIRQYGKILPDLNRSLPNMAPLIAIVSSINFESLALPTSVATPPGTCYAQQARRDAASDASRVAIALQAAKTDEELVAALKDANDACRGGAGARAAVLETLAPEIASSAAHTNATIRSHAHNLLLKCMRFSPRPSVTRDLAAAFIRCLESSDLSVTQSALEKLPDVVVLAQESLVDILSAVFNLGVHGGFNVTQYIADTINVLNSSLGY